MKKLQKINCFLFVVLSLVTLAPSAMAFIDTTQTDVGKTTSKFSDLVQKGKENYDNIMERISNSQFATTVGDGIKKAKEGVAWVQGKISEVQEKVSRAIGTVNKYKDKVLNDPRVQAAKLSPQVAAIYKDIKALEESRKEQIAAIDANVAVEQSTLDEKLKLSEQNVATAMEIYNAELSTAQTEDEKARIQKEMDEFQQGSTVEKEEFDKNIKKIKDDAEKQKKVVIEDFAAQIYEQMERAKELEQQIEELLSQAKTENGTVEEDPTQVIEKRMEDLSYKEGEEISLQDRKDKERRRSKRVTNTIIRTFNTSTSNLTTTDDTKDKQKIFAGLSQIQLGESETTQSAVESTVNQLDAIYNYLMIELQAIELETALILSKSATPVGKAVTNTDICNYSGKSCGGFMGAINSVKQTAGSMVSTAQNAVNDAKSVVSTVSSATTSAVETGKGMVNNIKNAASGLSSDASGMM